jgi:general secretion pathway protein E
MNAAVAEIPAAAAGANADPKPTSRDTLDEQMIARALAEAEESGQSARELLSKQSGLSGAAFARALARTFDYRFVAESDLARMEPDFGVLAPAEATRRSCLVVHDGGNRLAVFSDPFDTELRPWLEIRLEAPIEWVLAAREDLANLTFRHAETLRAIDAVLPDAQRGAKAEKGIDTLSYVSISEDASPVVRLVHSTVYDALRAGASDIQQPLGS